MIKIHYKFIILASVTADNESAALTTIPRLIHMNDMMNNQNKWDRFQIEGNGPINFRARAMKNRQVRPRTRLRVASEG